MLSGTTLMCPWHCYEFDVTTGENLDNPFMRVERFPVKVEDGEIFIEVG
jgi:nitrite reductase/ring-hydroxylating ferredoxin subunit